jgi:uncharacterized protein (PEP-CTERM system associated)
VILTSKLARLAAGASLVALSAATVATAQPLANPATPVRAEAVTPRARMNEGMPTSYLRPRIGVQAAVTDNVGNTSANEQSDVIGRVTVGLDAWMDSVRTRASVSGDVIYDAYSKAKKNDQLTYRGTFDASFVLVPEILALEAAGARTQGSLSTFGTTEFIRSSSGSDFQVTNYYVGPHLTLSPGILDISAAARYGQVFYDGPKAATTPAAATLPPETSIYQLIGAADTKDNLGRLRLVTSGQYQQDDGNFDSTSGSVSAFYQVTPRFAGIARAGYDDMNLTDVLNLSEPFWSVGGQYVFNEMANIRLEGGQRYDEPYYAGSAALRVARVIYLSADYSSALSPGPISISNMLVDYVGGLDQPLPTPILPPAFGLNSNFYNLPSLNRTGTVRALMDLGRHQFDYTLTSNQQKFETANASNRTLSQSVSYTNQVRPDLALSLRFLYASERLNGQLAVGPGDREGYYYLTTAGADYRLNRRTTARFQYQNRHFRPAQATMLEGYDENIASIALFRTF